mmetsp:Transcript_13679/g.32511  ORF Transcript_13679/g.32511 Transcript_13679/m.32511 type:complete len:374 (+) Transcript_13679:1185-2306(+)
MCGIDKGICLVDDFIAKNHLDDVLQRDDALDLVVRILRRIVIVDIPHQGHVAVSLLEVAQHIAQTIVWPNDVQTTTKYFGKGTDGSFVLGVDEDEVFGKEQPDDVVPGHLVDGNAAEARLEDCGNQVVPQPRIGGQHVRVLDGRHDLLDGHILIHERASHGGAGFLIESSLLDVNFQQLGHLGLAVGGAELVSQELVEGPPQRRREGKHEAYDDLDDGDGPGSDLESVPAAGGLGENLAKDDNDSGGHQKASQSTGDVGHEDGQKGIDGDVAQEEGAQQPISILANGIYAFGGFAHRRIVSVHDNFEPGDVQAHEAEGQAGEEGRHADQKDDQYPRHPGGKAGRYGIALLAGTVGGISIIHRLQKSAALVGLQ